MPIHPTLDRVGCPRTDDRDAAQSPLSLGLRAEEVTKTKVARLWK